MQINEYLKRNNSYKKSLVFHFGAFAGFYSEYNNMLNAMAFCLVNRIRFRLYSADAVICSDKGWNDFFCPFLEREETDDIHHIKNVRFPNDRQQTYSWRKYAKRRIKRLVGIKAPSTSYHFYELYIRNRKEKRKYGFTFFTQDLWNDFETINHNQFVKVPNLFSGSYFELLKEIDAMIWQYNSSTASMVNNAIHTLNLPNSYAGLHIRAGDKITEHIIYSPSIYMGKLLSADPTVRNVFVFTDDYKTVECLKENYNNINFYTLCDKKEQGYSFSELMSNSNEQKYDRTIRMFASVDILKKSNIFVGTRSSNPFLPIYLNKNKQNCFALDWQS